MEALTVINRYMDEHSDDYIFILNGYKDLLDRTIFKVQPGLRRRIQWTFLILKIIQLMDFIKFSLINYIDLLDLNGI